MKRIWKFSLLFLVILSLTQTVGAQKQISLEDIWKNNTFAVKRIGGIRSMKNGEHYTTFNPKVQAVVMYEYKSGNAVDTLLKSSWLNPKPPTPGGEQKDKNSLDNTTAMSGGQIEMEEYQFNADESKILVTSESEQIYRHSTKENYYIYDRKSKQTTFISTNGKQLYAAFSPDGKNIGFVRDNNLFIYEISTGKESRITSDGKTNNIINGSTDWVYEEEFSFAQAWFWSPDGSKIAFYRFDESNVKEFSMNKYSTLYPTEYKFKYPKAGEENSKVQIFIYDLKTKKNVSQN
jgi:dipeptidyl-peptidase 4